VGINDPPLDLDGQSFDLRYHPGSSDLEGVYSIPLLGRHQLNNAVAAIAALDLLRRDGVSLEPREMRQGLADVHWPGRLEILGRDPLVVVDCAHNGDSAAKLSTALHQWFPGRRWTFILGASSDKDVPGMVRELATRADRIIATQSRHPRAMSPQTVAEVAEENLPQAEPTPVEVTTAVDVASAFNLALDWDGARPSSLHPAALGQSQGAICVTGSIFVVADAREVWALSSGNPLPEADDPMDIDLLSLDHNLMGKTPSVSDQPLVSAQLMDSQEPLPQPS
jgi:dihydrofolate synthase/folylpolyglutamate synthase